MRRTLYETEHEAFRESFRRFLQAEFVPHLDEWDTAGIVAREFYTARGRRASSPWTRPRSSAAGVCPTSASTP